LFHCAILHDEALATTRWILKHVATNQPWAAWRKWERRNEGAATFQADRNGQRGHG
jgi:hypothetical protein